jgi:flagellar L-ring protein precursor FlgH
MNLKNPTKHAAISLLIAPVAFAQTDNRPAAPVNQPPAVQTAEQIAATMFASGSSLLAAQLAAGGNVTRGTEIAGGIDSRISFWAIPAPEPTLVRQHDLLTVIVREESTSRSAGSTDLEKEYDLSAELREYVDFDLSSFRVVPKSGGQGFDGEVERSFAGDGKTDRRDSFVTRITAEVIDVKPNGTLVIQARKRITTDEDEQLIVLTGTCRTADVTAANTVLSTQLHDLHLQKHTRGPVRDASQRGIVPRVVDRINPF